MEKKNYHKPDMRVVMMKHHGYLLQETSPTPIGGDGGDNKSARSFRWDDNE